MKLRVQSDGSVGNTQVLLNGEPMTGVVRIDFAPFVAGSLITIDLTTFLDAIEVEGTVIHRYVLSPNPDQKVSRSDVPVVGTRWKHHSGRIYEVTEITNVDADGGDPRYPITVVYVNVVNGTVWSRPAYDWNRSFEPLS